MRGAAGDPTKAPRHNMRAMFASGLPRVPVVAHVLQGALRFRCVTDHDHKRVYRRYLRLLFVSTNTYP